MDNQTDIVRLCRMVDLQEALESKGLRCSEYEELAFALAHSMSSGLSDYQQHKAQTEAALVEALERMSELQTSLDELRLELDQTVETELEQAAVVASCEKYLAEVDARPWIRIIRWLYMLIHGKEWRADRAEAVSKLETAQNARGESTKKIESLENEIDRVSVAETDLQSDTIDPLESESASLQRVPRIVDGLGEIVLPVLPVTMQKHRQLRRRTTPQVSMFIGGIEGNKTKQVAIPEIERATQSDFQQKMEDAFDTIEAYNSERPVLEATDSERETFGDLRNLVGIETRLVETISFLNEVGGSCRTQYVDLPLVLFSSPLADVIQERIARGTNRSSDQVFDKYAINTVNELRELFTSARALLDLNETTGDEIQEIVERVDNRLRLKYEEAHENQDKGTRESVQAISRARSNAELVRYNYYCPLCNVSPAFVRHRYGLDLSKLGDFAVQPTSVVRAGLSRYQSGMFEVLNARMGVNVIDSDRVRESWMLACDRLQQMENDIAEDERFVREADAGSAVSRERTEAKRRGTRAKRVHYKNVVMNMLHEPYKEAPDLSRGEQGENDAAGKATERSFEDSTKLFYDPGSVRGIAVVTHGARPWSCSSCKESFTGEEALMGAVDRVKFSIITPLVSTLWNSESVWNQALELFSGASREIRDRLVEETQTLQAPIDQFLADSREVRSKLQEHFARSTATVDRMKLLASDFRDLGLIDEEEARSILQTAEQNDQRRHNVDGRMSEMNHLENRLQRTPTELFVERQLPALPSVSLTQELLREGVFRDTREQSDEISDKLPGASS